MKTYKILLTSIGGMTQMPDSQKIFGALVYMFSDEYGTEKANKFVKDILDKKIFLALSNLLPNDYLPTPVDYLVDKLHNTDTNKELDIKKVRKDIKKRHYLQKDNLNKILKNPLCNKEPFPYVKIVERQQLSASIESVKLDTSALDSNLYSVPYITPVEIDKKNSPGSIITKFNFFLQIDDSVECSEFFKMIIKAVNLKQNIILGKRASQGLNIFQLNKITDYNIISNSENMFLNMGMLLPDNINFVKSTLQLFTSERRPYEISGGWNSDFERRYISFIKEGSVISIPNNCRDAVKSIESPFDSKSIVFGNAFLYPMPEVGGVKND